MARAFPPRTRHNTHHNPQARIALSSPETSGNACSSSQLKHSDADNVSEWPAHRFVPARPWIRAACSSRRSIPKAAAASMPRGACGACCDISRAAPSVGGALPTSPTASLAQGMPGAFLIAELRDFMQEESANGRAHLRHHELVAAKLRKLLLANRGVHPLQRLLVLGRGVRTMLLAPVVHMAPRMEAPIGAPTEICWRARQHFFGSDTSRRVSQCRSPALLPTSQPGRKISGPTFPPRHPAERAARPLAAFSSLCVIQDKPFTAQEDTQAWWPVHAPCFPQHSMSVAVGARTQRL